jgi:hypothetical protein
VVEGSGCQPVPNVTTQPVTLRSAHPNDDKLRDAGLGRWMAKSMSSSNTLGYVKEKNDEVAYTGGVERWATAFQ